MDTYEVRRKRIEESRIALEWIEACDLRLEVLGTSVSDNTLGFAKETKDLACDAAHNLLKFGLSNFPVTDLEVIESNAKNIRNKLGMLTRPPGTASEHDAWVVSQGTSIGPHINQLRAIWNGADLATKVREFDEGLFRQIEAKAEQQGKDIDNRLQARSAQLDAQLKAAQDTQAQILSKKAESESLFLSMQTTAQKVAVAAEAKHFEAQANTHKSMAMWWLGTTVFIATGSLVAAWLVFFKATPPAAGTGNILHYLSARLVTISILLFSLAWSSRNYKAHRHNEVLNRHRTNALTTFQTFVKSTNDEQTKNAILVQASQAIFSPQPSGYLLTDAEPAPQNTIVEVIRKVTETKPSST